MKTARVRIGRLRLYLRPTFLMGWRTQHSMHHQTESVSAMPKQILEEQGIAAPPAPAQGKRIKARIVYLGPLEIRWEPK